MALRNGAALAGGLVLLAACRRDEVTRYRQVESRYEPIGQRTFAQHVDCRGLWGPKRLLSDVKVFLPGPTHAAVVTRAQPDVLQLVEFSTCDVGSALRDVRLSRLDSAQWSPSGDVLWVPLVPYVGEGPREPEATFLVRATRPPRAQQISQVGWRPLGSPGVPNGPQAFDSTGTVCPVASWLPDAGPAVAIWRADAGFAPLRFPEGGTPGEIKLEWVHDVPQVTVCGPTGCAALEPASTAADAGN